jgi:hypothetical protein
MKFGKLFISGVLSTALFFSAVGFAAEKASLEISNPITVNGKSLPAGKYAVTWDGSGPNLELKFAKGKNVVATAPAQTINLNRATVGTSITTKDNPGGSPTLTQIAFDGKKYALAIGEGATQAADSSTK